MAQVRAVRRPFVSRRGRANDAHSQDEATHHAQTEVELLVLVDDGAGQHLSEASNEEREASGTGHEMTAVEALVDDTETALLTEQSTVVPDTFGEHPLRSESVPAPAPAPALEQPTMDASYESWTVPQLASELKRRELPSSGSKPDLVARLQESDRV